VFERSRSRVYVCVCAPLLDWVVKLKMQQPFPVLRLYGRAHRLHQLLLRSSAIIQMDKDHSIDRSIDAFFQSVCVHTRTTLAACTLSRLSPPSPVPSKSSRSVLSSLLDPSPPCLLPPTGVDGSTAMAAAAVAVTAAAPSSGSSSSSTRSSGGRRRSEEGGGRGQLQGGRRRRRRRTAEARLELGLVAAAAMVALWKCACVGGGSGLECSSAEASSSEPPAAGERRCVLGMMRVARRLNDDRLDRPIPFPLHYITFGLWVERRPFDSADLAEVIQLLNRPPGLGFAAWSIRWTPSRHHHYRLRTSYRRYRAAASALTRSYKYISPTTPTGTKEPPEWRPPTAARRGEDHSPPPLLLLRRRRPPLLPLPNYHHLYHRPRAEGRRSKKGGWRIG
jgi:hypothetical protein